MKIDGHPFPTGTNKVEISLMKGKAKVLTSARAKESAQQSGYCAGHMTGLEDLLSFSAGPINFGDRGHASQFGLQLTREKIISRLSWNVSACGLDSSTISYMANTASHRL